MAKRIAHRTRNRPARTGYQCCRDGAGLVSHRGAIMPRQSQTGACQIMLPCYRHGAIDIINGADKALPALARKPRIAARVIPAQHNRPGQRFNLSRQPDVTTGRGQVQMAALTIEALKIVTALVFLYANIPSAAARLRLMPCHHPVDL